MRDGTRFVGGASFTLALMLTGPVAGTADAQLADDAIPALMPEATAVDACRAIFGPDPFDDVPARALVSPGERLSLDLTWGTGWKAGTPVEIVNCTAVDRAFSDALSSRNRDVINDGLFLAELNVPAGLSDGARLCGRAVVIGQSAAGAPKGERLEAECFTVAVAAAGSSNDAGAAANRRKEEAGQRDRAATGGASPPSAAPQSQPGVADGPTPSNSAPPDTSRALARTGSTERMLAALAGLLLLVGGRMIAWARPPRRFTASR